jgi:thiol-disulfide isomerase/thioredoxin
MLIKSLFTTTGFSVLLLFCNPDYNDAKEILKKSYEKCQSIQNGYYEMTVYLKATSGKDTATGSYSCHFDKLLNDPIFSSAFHYKYYEGGQYKADVMYTGSDFVKTNVQDNVALVMSKVKRTKDIEAKNRECTFYSPFISRKSSPLPRDSDFIDGKHLFKLIGEEDINNISCYHIQENEIPFDEKDSPIKTLKIEYHFWISKTDFIPIQYAADFEGVMQKDTIFQYSKQLLTKYEINNLRDKSVLTLESIPGNYKRLDNLPVKATVPISVDAIANLYSLNGDKISISELKGNFVLVDFFYSSCHPCIQAIPTLQALHNKYKNKGLKVIGIDPYDKDTYDLSRFVSRHGITYPVLLENEDARRKYGIQGYPTIFLLDKSGKIIYQNMGYNKNLEKEVDQLILDHEWKD